MKTIALLAFMGFVSAEEAIYPRPLKYVDPKNPCMKKPTKESNLPKEFIRKPLEYVALPDNHNW